jgi:hypothetical protein
MATKDYERGAKEVGYSTSRARGETSGERVISPREKVRVSSYTPSMTDLEANERAVNTTMRMLGGIAEIALERNQERDAMQGTADRTLGKGPRKSSRAYMMNYDATGAVQDSPDVISRLASIEARKNEFQTPEDYEKARRLLLDETMEGKSPVYQATMAKNISDYRVTEAERMRREKATRSLEDWAVAGDYEKMQVAHSDPKYTRAQTKQMATDAVKTVQTQLSSIQHPIDSPEYFAESQRIVSQAQAQLTDSLLDSEDAVGIEVFTNGITEMRNSIERSFRQGEVIRNTEKAIAVGEETAMSLIDDAVGIPLRGVMEDSTGTQLQQLQDILSDPEFDNASLSAKIEGQIKDIAQTNGVSTNEAFEAILPSVARQLNKAGAVELLNELEFENTENQRIWNASRDRYDLTGETRDARLRQKARLDRDDEVRKVGDYMKVSFSKLLELKNQRAYVETTAEKTQLDGEIYVLNKATNEFIKTNAKFFSEDEQEKYQGLYSNMEDASVSSFVQDYVNGVGPEELTKKYATVGPRFTTPEEHTEVAKIIRMARDNSNKLFEDNFKIDIEGATAHIYDELVASGATADILQRFQSDRDLFYRRILSTELMTASKEQRPVDYSKLSSQIPSFVKAMEARQPKEVPTGETRKGRELFETQEGVSMREAFGMLGATPNEATTLGSNISDAVAKGTVSVKEVATDIINEKTLTPDEVEAIYESNPEVAEEVLLQKESTDRLETVRTELEAEEAELDSLLEKYGLKKDLLWFRSNQTVDRQLAKLKELHAEHYKLNYPNLMAQKKREYAKAKASLEAKRSGFPTPELAEVVEPEFAEVKHRKAQGDSRNKIISSAGGLDLM